MTTEINGRLFLRSIYIDNYKCFSRFKLPFGDMTLLAGKNGCGKTTVFEVINALLGFVCHGELIDNLFHPSTLTRWNNNNKQSFELCASDENGDSEFCYRLTVEHYPKTNKTHKVSEELTLDGKPLFLSEGGIGNVYIDYKFATSFDIPFDKVSGLGYADGYKDHPQSKFRDWLSRLSMLSLVPEKMCNGSDIEEHHPNTDGSNFASWYRWMLRKNYTTMATANEQLQRILPGYLRMELAEIAELSQLGGEEHCELQAVFSNNGKETKYAFAELSAGQRVLIALYCFLHGGGRNRVLLLDTPDNYITLPEVQPLFAELEMDAGKDMPQIAMISHHPDAINFISPKETVWLAREPEQAARIVEFENDTMLHTSKLFAQGMVP